MRATKRLVPKNEIRLVVGGGEERVALVWGVLYPQTGWMHPLMIHAMRVVFFSARKMINCYIKMVLFFFENGTENRG